MSSLIYSNILWPIFRISHFFGTHIYQKVSFKLINDLFLTKILGNLLEKVDYVISIIGMIRVWTFLNLISTIKGFSHYNKSENEFNFSKFMQLVKIYKIPYPFAGKCLEDFLINAFKIKISLLRPSLRLCLV